MSIPAASGYPQYSGSLIHPRISPRILNRVYEKAVTPGITDTSYYGDIRNTGDQVTFFRSPTAVVRASSKGGQIVHDTLSTSPITITIDHALEASIKVDPLDKRMVANWPTLEAGYMEDLARQIERHIDTHFLNSLYVGNSIAPENKGANAGIISRNINMGAPGAPLVLTSSNVLEFLVQAELVFRERSVDVYNDGVWLVGPPQLSSIIGLSDLKAMYFSGLTRGTALLNNRITENKIYGFDIMLTNNAPRVWDAVAGKWCYHLLFGMRKCNAFAFTNVQSREIEDVDDWNRYTQSRYVYGFGTIYPEFMADAYITFTV